MSPIWQLALARQLTELTGTHEEREALKEAKEKEERVELLRRQIGRRIMNQGLVRGWTAWFELWSEKVSQQAMLKQVGNRLLKPALSAAFGHWYGDWREATIASDKALLLGGQQEMIAQFEFKSRP